MIGSQFSGFRTFPATPETGRARQRKLDNKHTEPELAALILANGEQLIVIGDKETRFPDYDAVPIQLQSLFEHLHPPDKAQARFYALLDSAPSGVISILLNAEISERASTV